MDDSCELRKIILNFFDFVVLLTICNQAFKLQRFKIVVVGDALVVLMSAVLLHLDLLLLLLLYNGVAVVDLLLFHQELLLLLE